MSIVLTENDVIAFAKKEEPYTKFLKDILSPFVSNTDNLKITEIGNGATTIESTNEPKLILLFYSIFSGPRIPKDDKDTNKLLSSLYMKYKDPEKCKIFIVLPENSSGSRSLPWTVFSVQDVQRHIPDIQKHQFLTLMYEIKNMQNIIKKDDNGSPNLRYCKSKNILHKSFQYRDGYTPKDECTLPSSTDAPSEGGNDPASEKMKKYTRIMHGSTILYACLFA